MIVSRGSNDRDASPISRCHSFVLRFYPRRFCVVVLMPIHFKFVKATSTPIDIQSLPHKLQLIWLLIIYGLLFDTHKILLHLLLGLAASVAYIFILIVIHMHFSEMRLTVFAELYGKVVVMSWGWRERHPWRLATFPSNICIH